MRVKMGECNRLSVDSEDRNQEGLSTSLPHGENTLNQTQSHASSDYFCGLLDSRATYHAINRRLTQSRIQKRLQTESYKQGPSEIKHNESTINSVDVSQEHIS
jgi:hypothetical protein